MKKLTYTKYSAMTPNQKAEAYWLNTDNMAKNKRGQSGPSLLAQTRFWNNAFKALNDFGDTLPN